MQNKTKIFNYELQDLPSSYMLILNDEPVRVYNKSRFSKQEAESRASDVVNDSIKLHGLSRVFYNGVTSVATMADNFFTKIKTV